MVVVAVVKKLLFFLLFNYYYLIIINYLLYLFFVVVVVCGVGGLLLLVELSPLDTLKLTPIQRRPSPIDIAQDDSHGHHEAFAYVPYFSTAM